MQELAQVNAWDGRGKPLGAGHAPLTVAVTKTTLTIAMSGAPSDIEQSAARLRRVVLVLARRLRPTLQSPGLSTAKLSVVGQLYRAGPLTPTELASREGVRLASLTRLVAELDRDGWLDREVDVADKRRSILSLTAVGRKRLIASAQTADAALAAAIAGVANLEELSVLRQACDLLERVSDSVGGPVSPPRSPMPEVTSRTGRERA